MEFIKLTAPAIRSRIRDAVLIGGGLGGMAIPYVKRCMEQGMGALVDKVSYHPYRLIPEAKCESEVQAWRALLASHNPSLSLWQGECGCPSRNGGIGALTEYDWNESRQARWLLRRVLSDLRLGIELTSFFHIADLADYGWGLPDPKRPNQRGCFCGLLRGGREVEPRQPCLPKHQERGVTEQARRAGGS